MTSDDDRPEGVADPTAPQAETMLELALYWHFRYLDIPDPLERARAWAVLIERHADLDVPGDPGARRLVAQA